MLLLCHKKQNIFIDLKKKFIWFFFILRTLFENALKMLQKFPITKLSALPPPSDPLAVKNALVHQSQFMVN
jgi:hypothetical protein